MEKKSDKLSTFALCSLISSGIFSPIWIYILRNYFYDLFKTEFDMLSFTMFTMHLLPFLIGASTSIFFLYLSGREAVKEVEIEQARRKKEQEERNIAKAIKDAEHKLELQKIDERYHARMKEIDEEFKAKMRKIREEY